MPVNPEISDTMECAYQSLMLAYAAGALDEAQSLIVASHLALSAQARSLMRDCEAIGGAILEHECEPVPMKSCALGTVMDKIMNPCGEHKSGPCAGHERNQADRLDLCALPAPLARTLTQQTRPLRWKRIMRGIEIIDLDLSCKNSRSRFVKVCPGGKAPHHRHDGIEITLVLDGAFSDETGQYAKGDLLIADENTGHAQFACPSGGCICLVVSARPVRLTGLAALLNPFVRF